LLDGMMHIEDIAARLKEIGQDAIAITEHGNLYSSVEAYSKLSKEGIKVIEGCEVYICDDVNVKSKDSKYYHLILLSKNEVGRMNLNWLVSQSTLYKYYGKPRIDFDMLKEHHEGLICLSACMAGEVQRCLMNDDVELAKQIALKYKELFEEDYYIETQAHSGIEQQVLNKKLIALANSLNIKYTVTCDAHYIRKEDQKYHDVFVQIGTSREAGEIYDDCYLQSEDDVIRNSTSIRECIEYAIKTTHEIADKCENTIPLSAPIIPHFPVPAPYKSELEYLKFLCNDGLKNKGFMSWNMDQWNKYMTDEIYTEDGQCIQRKLVEFNSVKEIQQIYIKRARYEMHALEAMGFEGYYLMVHSYVNAAKRRGIARGSGGGSLLAYLCGIVDIDPIKYGLYFERFIDVGAIDLLKDGTITKKELKIPDFDVDFAPNDREKVVQFVVDKYGEENVVSLGQFSYLWAKGAIKDIGRVLGIPFEITNEITKNLDGESIEEALDNGVLDSYKDKYPQLFEYASKLSGLPKSFGVHPCGKCITIKEAEYYNAIEWNDNKNTWVLEGDMHSADDLGLVKADFLGLRTLDVIYDVLDMIGKDYNYIAPHKINMNDVRVWNEFAQGHTNCIFQFESPGMKQMLKDMKCNCMDELSAANALYRPGSKQYIPNYVNRKNGVEKIEYLHQDLESILKSSYGIIVFQEQLIEIGRLAGLRNPDELRKATAKKKPKLMAKIEPELKSGLMLRGWTQEQVDDLWNTILQFAKYSFNKSHSSAYGLTAYITMFLKVYHTAEFFTACINSYDGDIDNIVKTIQEAKRMGIVVKYDKWSKIQGKTICKDGVVYLGINTIKGCGENVSHALQAAGDIESDNFFDILNNLNASSDINSGQIESLIYLNFFSEYSQTLKLLKINNVYNMYHGKKIIKKDKINLPLDLVQKYTISETAKQYRFDEEHMNALLREFIEMIPDSSIPLRTQLEKQSEYLGYLSYSNKTAKDTGYVVDVNTKYSPKITIYRFDTGETITYKLQKNAYQKNPFDKGTVLKFYSEMRNKSKLVDGQWVKSEDQEPWITNYVVSLEYL
jgi:DNA polymerase-3 subunit alpha